MIALAWSGGKDCARALEVLRGDGSPPELLLTTVDEVSGRVNHHEVGPDALREQAAAAGLPLVEISIPQPASAEAYAERMRAAFDGPLSDVSAVAFGDLLLEDLRTFRERRLREVGREALFPLWGRPTSSLAREIIRSGYEATIVAVDPATLSPELVGCCYDLELLSSLPAGVDPCGENGEFHTFVSAGPCFVRPLVAQARG